MINLRYHIVSITAVFLALGIGLAMGSTLLSEAAVDQVSDQVESAEERIEATRQENGRLSERVEGLERRDEQLRELAAPQLLVERLEQVPVLVLAPTGIAEESVGAVRDGLEESGATFGGTLLYTGKLNLESDDDAEQLSTLLDSSSTEPAQLRRLLASRLATLLTDAAEPPDDDTTTTTTDPGVTSTLPPPTTEGSAEEPGLITALLDAGFMEFLAPESAAEGAPVLVGQGFRYAIVSGAEPDVADRDFLLPLLRQMTFDGPAPVVVASAPSGEMPEETRGAVVGPIRDDDQLSDGVTTVDNLESFNGLVSVIFALEDLDQETRGHYGVGDGTTAAMPEPGGS